MDGTNWTLFSEASLDDIWQFFSGVFTGTAGAEVLRRILDVVTGVKTRRLSALVRVVNDFDAELDHIRDMEAYAASLETIMELNDLPLPVTAPESIEVVQDERISYKSLMRLRNNREQWQRYAHRLRVTLTGAGVTDIEPPPDPPVWTSIVV